MKELAIYFSDMKRLLELDDALREIDLNRIPAYLVTLIFAQNPNVYDYSVNLTSLPWIRMLQERQGIDFTRLYFGQEFCQNLIPSAEDVEQAYYFSRQLGWSFTYVTGGSHAELGVEKVRKNLDVLQRLEAGCEVVVNDWGILNILAKEYPSFKLVLGRILNKQTRLNLFAGNSLFPMYSKGIELPEEELRMNQLKAYADVSLSNPDYLEFLKGLGIEGVDFDMTPQGIIRPADGWGMSLGYYYPWTFVAMARNCATAGVKDPERTFVITEKACGRACQRINCSPQMNQFELPIVQRGTALFVSSETIANAYLDEEHLPYERLIFEPYIPI